MALQPLLIAVLAAAAMLGLLELLRRWEMSRRMSRVLDRARNPGKYPPVRLEPESRFIVRLFESEVSCEHADGTAESIVWTDLQKFEIITTSDGPFAPDVFWVLHGTNHACAIPQGATGEDKLLERLYVLPGFDNKAFSNAMSCTADKTFLCWQKTK